MYVAEKTISEMAGLYGQPRRARFEFEVGSDREWQTIAGSQKHGRKHDVTVYAFKGDRVIVIAKPFYPPGLYRAPSGGLKPGEDFHDGTYREAWEETGCRIKLERFLLRTDVAFVRTDNGSANAGERIDWNSFVFQARYESGDFEFTDHREIREVRLATLDEFEDYSKIMRDSDIGGLHYRAALHDAVKGLLR